MGGRLLATAGMPANRPIRGGHEKPSFRLGGGGGRLQNAPSANAFL